MLDLFLSENIHQRQLEIILLDLIMFCQLQSARFSSGLSVNDFLKRHSLIKITKTGIERLSASVINLAKHENLEGHANSVKIRLKKEINWLNKKL